MPCANTGLTLLSAAQGGKTAFIRAYQLYSCSNANRFGAKRSGDGCCPHGSLIQSGSSVYAFTAAGGSSNEGTIFKINTDGSGYQLLHGEAVVMRLLRQNATLRGMGELDMDRRELDCFRRVLQLPHGIILVTGPTGSGKTSTLYTALNEINDSVRKIITVEDPVEYQLKGVNQIQVNEKSGLTFARGLRSILRHDPDVILIGEIRDAETAQIAVQASLTGHLVFSTLHTNDAPGALNRLVDMHVEPYLVASSLEAVLAQRLVRVLCPHCKVEDKSELAAALKRKLGYAPSEVFYKSVGCGECRQAGFQGRQAIFEWMDMNNEIIEMLLRNSSAILIRGAAQRNGMKSLSDDGWRLVRKGVTTPEEVMRVTKDQTLDVSKQQALSTEKPDIDVISESEAKPKIVVAQH